MIHRDEFPSRAIPWRLRYATALCVIMFFALVIIAGCKRPQDEPRPTTAPTAEQATSPATASESLVPWREWDDAVFAEAKEKGRLILLDIGATWCHWCHVMDETTYRDPRVLQLIEESYIPIRVDSDRRPDINARYNQGGWPSTVVITPSGLPLSGTTYLSPDKMVTFLTKVRMLYEEQRDEVTRRETNAQKYWATPPDAPTPGPFSESMVEVITNQIVSAADPAAGGLRSYNKEAGEWIAQPKFPPFAPILFALSQCAKDKEAAKALCQFAALTLNRQALGGIWAKAGFGFHPSAPDPQW